MKKYNEMKIFLKIKYSKAKKQLELANAKKKNYKSQLETKAKEIKYLNSEIKILKKREDMTNNGLNSKKFEGTELRGMRAFHESQLGHLKSSLASLEVDYHKRLDKIQVSRDLKIKEILSTHKIEIDNYKAEILSYKSKELLWGQQKDELLNKIKLLEGRKDNKSKPRSQNKAVSRRKQRYSINSHNSRHKSSVLCETIDPMQILKSSCEVLEELGIEIQNSAAKMSKISKLSNKLRNNTHGGSLSTSPHNQNDTGSLKKNLQLHQLRNKKLEFGSQRDVNLEYVSFGNRNQSLVNKPSTKKIKSTTNDDSKHASKDIKKNLILNNSNKNLYKRIKKQHYHTEPYGEPSVDSKQQEEDISKYIQQLGLANRDDKLQNEATFNSEVKNFKSGSLTQDINKFLQIAKKIGQEQNIEENSDKNNRQKDEFSSNTSYDSYQNVSKIIDGEINRDTFSAIKVPVDFNKNNVQRKNPTYLEIKNHNVHENKGVNSQKNTEVSKKLLKNQNELSINPENQEYGYELDNLNQNKSSSRSKLNSLINRVLVEHNSIKKKNETVEKKLEKIEDMISRLSEQQSSNPLSSPHADKIMVKHNDHANIKIIENGDDELRNHQLRKSAKKQIGFLANSKDISELGNEQDITNDFLYTEEKKMIAEYMSRDLSKNKDQWTNGNGYNLQLNPPVQNQGSMINKKLKYNGIDKIRMDASSKLGRSSDNLIITPGNGHRGSSPYVLQDHSASKYNKNSSNAKNINIINKTRQLDYMNTESDEEYLEEDEESYVSLQQQQQQQGQNLDGDIRQLYFTDKYQDILNQINGMKKEMEMINDENQTLLKVFDEE